MLISIRTPLYLQAQGYFGPYPTILQRVLHVTHFLQLEFGFTKLWAIKSCAPRELQTANRICQTHGEASHVFTIIFAVHWLLRGFTINFIYLRANPTSQYLLLIILLALQRCFINFRL